MILAAAPSNPPPTPRPEPAPAAPAISRSTPAVRALGRSVPTRLDIPAIGVHTTLISLGLHSDGTVAVPPLRSGAPAGWYRGLAAPGETGPAILLGHVDTARDGPAVFYRLGALHRGDRITVSRTDGARPEFTVTDVDTYPKDAFPSTRIYGDIDHSVLRLITCGGTFDRSRGSYRSNVVVYADLTTPVR